jgi:hypothetical protein
MQTVLGLGASGSHLLCAWGAGPVANCQGGAADTPCALEEPGAHCSLLTCPLDLFMASPVSLLGQLVAGVGQWGGRCALPDCVCCMDDLDLCCAGKVVYVLTEPMFGGVLLLFCPAAC